MPYFPVMRNAEAETLGRQEMPLSYQQSLIQVFSSFVAAHFVAKCHMVNEPCLPYPR